MLCLKNPQILFIVKENREILYILTLEKKNESVDNDDNKLNVSTLKWIQSPKPLRVSGFQWALPLNKVREVPERS